MYVDSCTYTVSGNGNQYTRHLLRESFRKNGKIRHRTLANLSPCSPAEIQAIKLALRHKHNLQELGDVKQDISVKLGVSCGAVLVLWQVARRLGLVDALGSGQIIFSRWDYPGLPHAYVRPLMVMNPDGTGQQAVYGSSSYYPNALFFPQQVPGQPNRIAANRRYPSPWMN